MKKLLSILLVGLLFIPMLASADTVSMGLEDVLIEEGIKYDLKDYKESDDKINIYLFRGNGCGHCKNFVTFLYENIDELGKYFNLVSYEIFYNQDNSKLMSKVSKFFGEEADGVPYIVIGDKYFAGFGEGAQEDIKNAIKELYNSKDRYDVFEEMSKPEETKDTSAQVIAWNAFFIAIATSVILFVNNRKFNELNTKIEKLQKSNYVQKNEYKNNKVQKHTNKNDIKKYEQKK